MTQTIPMAEHQRAMQNYKNEMGKAMRTNHNLRVANKDLGADCTALRETMYEIEELIDRGLMREAKAAIANERRIYESKREQRKGKAA